jgi:hypothetical protein
VFDERDPGDLELATPKGDLNDAKPWFVPLVAGWYRLQDSVDRAMAKL